MIDRSVGRPTTPSLPLIQVAIATPLHSTPLHFGASLWWGGKMGGRSKALDKSQAHVIVVAALLRLISINFVRLVYCMQIETAIHVVMFQRIGDYSLETTRLCDRLWLLSSLQNENKYINTVWFFPLFFFFFFLSTCYPSNSLAAHSSLLPLDRPPSETTDQPAG